MNGNDKFLEAIPHQDQEYQDETAKFRYDQILKQMEFYFSDANLSKDRFLSHKLKSTHELPLDMFLSFNKIRELTQDVKDIKKALERSNFLCISKDGKNIFRRTKVRQIINQDDSTIYVENIPPDAEHEWLQSIFSNYGRVLYISIPKNKDKKNKGYAFVEYLDSASVHAVLEAFGAAGCRISPDIPCEQLLSVRTFENDGGKSLFRPMHQGLLTFANVPPGCNKRQNESKVDEDTPDSKKSKVDGESSENNHQVQQPQQGHQQQESVEIIKEGNGVENGIHDNIVADVHSELSTLGLQILPKKEWKKLRNSYLNAQRKKLLLIKTHKAPVADVEAEVEEAQVVTEEVNCVTTPGIIVKITMDTTNEDLKQLKKTIQAKSNACYVDIIPGKDDIFVRLKSNELANAFVQTQCYSNMKLLEGEEEIEYWKKIQSDREKTKQLKEEREKKRRKFERREPPVANPNEQAEAKRSHIRF